MFREEYYDGEWDEDPDWYPEYDDEWDELEPIMCDECGDQFATWAGYDDHVCI